LAAALRLTWLGSKEDGPAPENRPSPRGRDATAGSAGPRHRADGRRSAPRWAAGQRPKSGGLGSGWAQVPATLPNRLHHGPAPQETATWQPTLGPKSPRTEIIATMAHAEWRHHG